MVENTTRLDHLKSFATARNNESSRYGFQRPVGNYEVGYHTFLVALAIMIILHNLVVIILYSKKRSLRNSTNMLLASTACADTLTGVLLIPFVICSAALFNRGRNLRILYFTSTVITDLVNLAIALNILMVTLERYISLCHPYIHPQVARKSVIRGLIGSIWLIAFLLAIIQLIWSYPSLVGEEAGDLSDIYKTYSLTLLIGVFFVPSLIMIFCLVSMFAVLKRFVKEDTLRGLPKNKGARSQRKAVFVFFAMFVNIFVCWSPLMCIRLVMDTKDNFRPNEEILELLFALRCCSSLFDPAIYVWCKKDFKRAFIRSMCHKSASRRAVATSAPNTQDNGITMKESLL